MPRQQPTRRNRRTPSVGVAPVRANVCWRAFAETSTRISIEWINAESLLPAEIPSPIIVGAPAWEIFGTAPPTVSTVEYLASSMALNLSGPLPADWEIGLRENDPGIRSILGGYLSAGRQVPRNQPVIIQATAALEASDRVLLDFAGGSGPIAAAWSEEQAWWFATPQIQESLAVPVDVQQSTLTQWRLVFGEPVTTGQHLLLPAARMFFDTFGAATEVTSVDIP